MYFAFYFLRYAATTGVIIYWKTDQTFVIHRYHHVWFGTYNSCLSIENKHTQCYLLLQQYPESLIHNSDLLNLIPCKLDVTSTPFSDENIITYDIELPHSGKKIGFNLLDNVFITKWSGCNIKFARNKVEEGWIMNTTFMIFPKE